MVIKRVRDGRDDARGMEMGDEQAEAVRIHGDQSEMYTWAIRHVRNETHSR